MHKVEIPQSIIDACVRFRGRRHAFESLEPERTALLVIDMQNSWLQPGFSPLEIPAARDIIPNINALAAAVRDAGGMVAWTQSTFPEDWTTRSYERFGAPHWRDRIIADTVPGSQGHRIAREMDVAEADLIVSKTRPSAFIQGSSNLEAELRARARDTLIITGTLTNACCESSARDAAALGFSNIMVSDAMATRTDVEHNATLVNVMQLVADVRSTKEVMDLLEPHRHSNDRTDPS
ncbi:MAG: cysteine hydrolase family protein [Gammaproteobacteria bacterium]